MRIAIAILAVFTSVSLLSAAKAAGGFYFNQDLGVSWNALGAALGTRIVYRIPLSQSDDILWSSTKIDVGIDNSLTPADNRIALYLQIEPIAVFDVTVLAGGAFAYKLLGYGFSEVGGYFSDVSENALATVPQEDKAFFFLKISPRLKAQFGPVIAANTLDYLYLGSGPESRYYYQRKEALVMRYSDACLVNNTYLLYDFSNGLFAGLNYYILWHPESLWGTQYAAALGAYEWKIAPETVLSFNLLLGWYTVDSYRQYNTLLPYVAGAAGLNIRI